MKMDKLIEQLARRNFRMSRHIFEDLKEEEKRETMTDTRWGTRAYGQLFVEREDIRKAFTQVKLNMWHEKGISIDGTAEEWADRIWDALQPAQPIQAHEDGPTGPVIEYEKTFGE